MSFPGFRTDPSISPPHVPRRRTVATYPVQEPGEAFRNGRVLARAWAERLDSAHRLPRIKHFMKELIASYARAIGHVLCKETEPKDETGALDFGAASLAAMLANNAALLDPISAAYWLSITYTSMLPDAFRSRFGVYYTPPALSARLLDLATEAGTDWRTCRVLDPACGGGAFLGPASLRMVDALKGNSAETILASIEHRLRGFEVDEFAAWLSQTFLEIALSPIISAAGRPVAQLVKVGDSLHYPMTGELYDLVIGNPPYGRVVLTPALRARFQRSLFGHANLYGVFTDLALRFAAPNGVIAFVTPTSFLAGEYFKSLRSILAAEAPPVAIDFIEARKGVFEDVLQETMLATYRRNSPVRKTAVHYVSVSTEGKAQVTRAGSFELRVGDLSSPWLIPRDPSQAHLIKALTGMKCRLADWGYKVSTGPLVWNRHKPQLRSKPGKSALPLIWAECIAGPGKFVFRAEKRNHQPYFKMQPGDDWLRIDQPCVLLQRTTAKEQSRRLIAAALPIELIDSRGGVVVENHLNMIRPVEGAVKVSPVALAAFLNSEIADLAFRCISGSVAVSAYELEALPVPSPAEMAAIENLVQSCRDQKTIDIKLRSFYLSEKEQLNASGKAISNI